MGCPQRVANRLISALPLLASNAAAASRPNSRHPNPFADHPKADIALLKLE